jgi:nicotinamide mononucleotide transporter
LSDERSRGPRLARSETTALSILTACVALVGAVMVWLGQSSVLEAVSFATGAVGVWLTVKENIWNFPIGIINTAGYSVVFFHARLYGDASLNVLYCILGVMGWYLWLHGGEERSALHIDRAGTRELSLVAGAIALGTLLLWKTLHFAGGSSSFWDAATTSLSLGAQWLLNGKKIENWHIWIVADLIYVPLYVSRGLNLTAFLYLVFLVMAVIGLFRWREVYEDQRARASMPAMIP